MAAASPTRLRPEPCLRNEGPEPRDRSPDADLAWLGQNQSCLSHTLTPVKASLTLFSFYWIAVFSVTPLPAKMLFIFHSVAPGSPLWDHPHRQKRLKASSLSRSAWWTIDRGCWHCTGGSDQDHPQQKEMQKGKMVVWGGLTNSWEKKRS